MEMGPTWEVGKGSNGLIPRGYGWVLGCPISMGTHGPR